MAKKPILAQESFAELQFPSKGIDLSRAFGSQQGGTTPVGVNVRAYEPGTSRNRGGSRPGILPYLPAAVPTGGLLQMLDTVIIGSAAALLDNIDDPGYGNAVVLDPSSAGGYNLWATGLSPNFGYNTRNPGRIIRRGGNGRMSNKNKKTPSNYVQSMSAITPVTGHASNPLVLPFQTPVKKNNLLLVAGNVDSTPTDTMGNTWQLVTGALGGGGFYYAIAKASGPNTVTVVSSQSYTSAAILEYTKIVPGNPFANIVIGGASAGATYSTGPLSVANGTTLVSFFFQNVYGPPFPTQQLTLSPAYPFFAKVARSDAKTLDFLPPDQTTIYPTLWVVDGRLGNLGAAITGTVAGGAAPEPNVSVALNLQN